MKVDTIRTFIAVCLGAFIGWGYYSMESEVMSKLAMGFIMGIEAAILIIATIGISYNEYPRSGVAIRAAGVFGLVVLLIMNGIYCYTGLNNSFYVLNGILLLVLLLTANIAYKSKQ